MLEVRVDGALGDAKVLRDVAVGHPLADQRRDLPFPAGQQAGRALAAQATTESLLGSEWPVRVTDVSSTARLWL